MVESGYLRLIKGIKVCVLRCQNMAYTGKSCTYYKLSFFVLESPRYNHGLTGEVDKRAIPGISWDSSVGWEGSMAFR